MDITRELNDLLLDQMWLNTNHENVQKMKQLLYEESDHCLINDLYAYATDAVWLGGDMDEKIPLFIDMCEMEVPLYLQCCYTYTHSKDKFLKLQSLYELIHARLVIDEAAGDIEVNVHWKFLPHASEGVLNRRQVALLENKKEDTIRNAMYAEGRARLKPFKDNLYRVDDVIHWQKAMGTFKATQFRRGDPCREDPSTGLQFKLWLQAFANPHSSPLVTFDQLRETITTNRQTAFDLFWKSPDEDTLLAWFSSQNALNLALLLDIKPDWLINQLSRCLLTELPEDEEFEKLRKKEPVSAELPATAELITKTIQECDWIESHALQQGKQNAKMNGYTSGKYTFTHEHNLKTQYFWLPVIAGEHLSLPKKRYLKKDLDQSGKYGRHSGLKKYQELAYEDLYKVEIHTYGDLQDVLKALKS
ncbi:hypothetical protein [Endozoicomonas sp. ALC013]